MGAAKTGGQSTLELLRGNQDALGFAFDFERIMNRIIKMTDNPDKVYSTAPLKKNN